MFNLEQSIQNWRNDLAALATDDIRELETHLRDDIERRMKSGMDAQRAFEVSIQQIGKPRALNVEFKKSGFSVVMEWLMIVICAGFLGLITLIGSATVVMCYSNLSDRVLAASAMIFTMIVALRWRYFVPFLPVIDGKLKRIATGIIGILISLFTPALVMNFFVKPGPVPQFPLVILWSFLLLTIVFCVSVGLGMSQREREKRGMTRRPL